jgi:hypothetical protein
VFFRGYPRINEILATFLSRIKFFPIDNLKGLKYSGGALVNKACFNNLQALHILINSHV